MKILIVTQYYYPENFRINDLSRELHERGHKVTVLTGKPNYPEGRFYQGYTYFNKSREMIDDIKVLRVPMLPRKKGSICLVLNYFSFAFSAWIKAKTMKNKDFDIIYVFETSPITVALPAIGMKYRAKAPILMNVQDLWPENVISITGLQNKFALKFLDKLVDYIYKHCDLILAASRSFVPKIQERITKKEKVVFWPQYSVVKRAEPEDGSVNKAECITLGDCFDIIFTGNIGQAQGLDIVAEAASLCKKEKPDIKIRWHLIGDGRARVQLQEKIKQLGVEEQVLFYGSKPENAIPAYLEQADAALLILKPDPIFDMTLPAKLQTYLACGAAILACTKGESKSLVEESGIGLACREVTAEALAEAALDMALTESDILEQYRRNALEYSKKYFDKDKIIDLLETYMNQCRE